MTVFEANRALLAAFRSGDRAALTKVYWHYVEAVERLLRLGFSTAEYRVPGLPSADIGDAVQETFTRALAPRARDAYDGLRPFRPYLLRIARNLLIDRARRSDRIHYGAALNQDTADQTAQSPEEFLASNRLRDATKDFVAQLDPRAREVVTLRFEEGRAQQEVATTLGITRRKVRTIETRLRRELAAHLRQAGLELAEQESSGPSGRTQQVPRRGG